MANLFVDGEFTSHSGLKLSYKVDCNVLTDADIECCARQIAERVSFRTVEGIPRGDLRLAECLKKYTTVGGEYDLLIVDDVLTTGKSMETWKEIGLDCYDSVIGYVIFARGELPDWVRCRWREER